MKGKTGLVNQAIMEESDFGVPAIDSADNVDWGDVGGNKSDAASTAATASQVALLRAIIVALGGNGNSHLQLFGGDIYYADAGQADDTGDGKSPETAKKTLLAAHALMGAGDRLSVKAGTYTDVGLDFDLEAQELKPEIGMIIEPATGTPLTISGDHCRVWDYFELKPPAGQIGMLVSGDNCVIERPKILFGAIGIQVTGAGVVLIEPAVGFPTSIAYDLQGAQGRLLDPSTVGNAATIGYQISGSADTGVIRNATSAGHTQSCCFIDNGSEAWTILDFSSGAGDGPPIDLNEDKNVWTNFSYDDEVTKSITFAGAPTTYNIFKVTGGVRIRDITGHVGTAIANTAANFHLELYSTNDSEDITDAPGPNIQNLPEGAILVRNADSTNQIDIGDPSSGPAVVENTNFRDPATAIDIVKDTGADTYVRLVISAALASGEIHFHAYYERITEDGLLEAA